MSPEHTNTENVSKERLLIASATLCVLLLVTILTVIFELCRQRIISSSDKSNAGIVHAMFSEITVLGFVALVFFVIARPWNENDPSNSSAIQCISSYYFTSLDWLTSVHRNSLLFEIMEAVHFFVFLIMISFVSQVLILLQFGGRLYKQKWSRYQEECLKDDEAIRLKYVDFIRSQRRLNDENNMLSLPHTCLLVLRNILKSFSFSRNSDVIEKMSFLSMRAEFMNPRDVSEGKLPVDFDFAEYLSECLLESILSIVEIPISAWIYFSCCYVFVFITLAFFTQEVLAGLLLSAGYIIAIFLLLFKWYLSRAWSRVKTTVYEQVLEKAYHLEIEDPTIPTSNFVFLNQFYDIVDPLPLTEDSTQENTPLEADISDSWINIGLKKNALGKIGASKVSALSNSYYKNDNNEQNSTFSGKKDGNVNDNRFMQRNKVDISSLSEANVTAIEERATKKENESVSSHCFGLNNSDPIDVVSESSLKAETDITSNVDYNSTMTSNTSLGIIDKNSYNLDSVVDDGHANPDILLKTFMELGIGIGKDLKPIADDAFNYSQNSYSQRDLDAMRDLNNDDGSHDLSHNIILSSLSPLECMAMDSATVPDIPSISGMNTMEIDEYNPPLFSKTVSVLSGSRLSESSINSSYNRRGSSLRGDTVDNIRGLFCNNNVGVTEPYFLNNQPEKPSLSFIFGKNPPNKQEMCLVGGVYGSFCHIFFLRLCLLIVASYVSLVLTSIPVFLELWHSFGIFLVLTAFPPVIAIWFFITPKVLELHCYLTCLEMMKRPLVVQKVVRMINFSRSIRAIRVLESLRSLARIADHDASVKCHECHSDGIGVEPKKTPIPTDRSRVLSKALEKLPKSKKKELQRTFYLFDTDSSGEIDISELSALMRAIGKEMSPGHVSLLMAELDTDGSGSVSFEEWLNWFALTTYSQNLVHERDRIRAFRSESARQDYNRLEINQIVDTVFNVMSKRCTDAKKNDASNSDVTSKGNINKISSSKTSKKGKKRSKTMGDMSNSLKVDTFTNNSDGGIISSVSSSVFADGMAALGHLSSAEVAAVVRDLDGDGNGVISRNEFILFLTFHSSLGK